MKDLKYALSQINGLARLWWFNESAGSIGTMIDSGPYAKNGLHSGYITVPFGANAQQPSHLLDQHQKKFGFCYSAGHGASPMNGTANFDQFSLFTGGADTLNPNNNSWSLVFAGLKPHDMSVERGWLGLTGAANAPKGMQVAINSDGTLLVGPALAAMSCSSSAGAIKRFTPQLLVISYDNSQGKLFAYVGDWSANFSTVINGQAASPITSYPGSGASFIGRCFNNSNVPTNNADGFLDALAIYIGHAITQSEAQHLQDQCGYISGNTYTRTESHRHSVINTVKATGATLDTNSTAAASEYYSTQILSPPSGAGSGGWNTDANSIAIFTVTKAYRDSIPTPGMLVGYTGYTGYAPGFMLNEDCPLPYGGLPSGGFLPSGLDSDGGWTGNLRARWLANVGTAAPASVWDAQGSDHTFGLLCPETDEYWEGYQIHNVNAPVAGQAQSTVGNPVWSVQFGQKQTQFSLQWGGGRDTEIGCRATGIPVILGTPTIAEQQAITAGTAGAAINKAVTGNCLNAKTGQQKWPALRNDGTNNSSTVVEGMIFRFKQDATTTSRIQAMHYGIGRAWATAIQKYGHIPNDKTLYGMLMQGEDPGQFKVLSLAGNAGVPIDPYYQGPNQIDQGAAFTGTIMADAPWDSLEVIDSNSLNPMWTGQTVRSAPIGIRGLHQPSQIHMAWIDDSLTDHWNIYQTAPVAAITLSSGLSTGSPITTLPVTALTALVPGGSQIVLTSGAHTQTFVSSGPALAGATTITVPSVTPNFAYSTSSVVTPLVLIGQTEWAEYTIWTPPGTLTLAVTSVNGGGESSPSLSFTPPLLPRSRRRVRTTLH